MSQGSIPPLPPDLERSAEALREREPSVAFAARLDHALGQQPAPSTRPSLWAGLALVVPALTAAVLVLHVTVGELQGTEPLFRFEEHHVTLDEAGQAWIELELWTHHHEGVATVSVETPASVHVDSLDDADRACGSHRCTHSFVATSPRSPLRVRVSERGRHSITVEHTSRTQRVRERFLVYAR